MPRSPESRHALLQALLLFALALAIRLWFSGRFFGWEEGDYGNLMHIREVRESGFTWFRASHMPGWYVMSALVHAALPHERLAGLLLTATFSAASVSAAAWVARRLLSPSASWLCGLWLLVQPEMALYGSSTLRSPVFASLGVLGLAALLAGARDRGFGLVALAFLTRMEGFFSMFPAALYAWGRDAGASARSLLVPLGMLLGVVVAWQTYLTVGLGEGVFIEGPLNVNLSAVAEGSPEGHFELLPWVREGLLAVWWQLTWTLPRKISWTWWGLALLGGWALWTRREGRDGGRSVVAFAVFGVGFWLGAVFLSRHDPNHNLYWAWMLHFVPFLAVLAAAGWHMIERRMGALPAAARVVVLALVVASALPSFVLETHYQAKRAGQWYRPQLDVSRWMEDELPDGSGVLVSSIPEVFLKRRESGLRVFSWWLLPGRFDGSDPGAFGEFLRIERIDYVMWFREEWTDSERIAPWLASGQVTPLGPVMLTPVDREDGYGWILFAVARPGEPTPPVPPRFGQGERGKGWALR